MKNNNNDMILEKPDNLVELFELATNKFTSNSFFGTKDLKSGVFNWVTYGAIGKRVDDLRGGLAHLNIQKGDAVGIICSNRADWAVAAFATYGLGARFVPMYESENYGTWEYIIKDANVKFLLVSSFSIYEQIKNLKESAIALEHIYIIDTIGDQSMNHLEAIGRTNFVSSYIPSSSEIACLIYTSGTTSEPKGVLLTHGNLVSNARAGFRRYTNHLSEKSVSLSILPWAHSYGQTAELYNWLFFGGSIGFMVSMETLADDFVKVKPTFLIAVPRVFNKIYAGIHQKMKDEGGFKLKLFQNSLKAARDYRLNEGRVPIGTKLMYWVGSKLVFSKIKERFGGDLVASITGSAQMNEEVTNFFADIGISVYNCYGLSETSPAITMNSPELNRKGSVGSALEFIKIRIDKTVVDDNSEDGEIQVSGPNLMVGYHNKPETTKEVFTEDGWLRTGDRGKLDADGFLYITGRLKEQFKLENGKYVFPSALEEDIVLLPYIESAMIYGDGRPYNICVVVPDHATLRKTAEFLNIKTEVDKLIHLPSVQEFVGIEIRKSLKNKYGGYEIPKKFIFSDISFTVENGFLTQTLKLKRRLVLDKFKDQIEALYQE
ncbi:long-chain fatty acid--CoA ligase [Flavobacterium sp. LM5]|uniref:AMP-dependent synthetase/ligase n=1 Tax=Flavobacterium sp. LM5 TaxID=1938610 RepID=UPI0009928A08|nr:long-chain fatty acid--CoA ligase [Flavobacterium sp. LM5]